MNKYLCVFGILRTKEGLKIKDEMLKWLQPLYDVICVEQEPPGIEFEYPAIKKALELSIEKNQPVLYIHTKGASNTAEVYQSYVRKIWQKLFGHVERQKQCFSALDNSPMVLCPYTGISKATWFNAFIVNASAAKIALAHIKKPSECNRYFYEQQLFNDKEILVKGILRNDCDDSKIMSKLIKERCRGKDGI